MKRMKQLFSLLIIMTLLVSTQGFITATATSDGNTTIEAPGWYLENYKLVINTKQTSGTFSQGGTYKDIVSITDLEGNEMQGLESDLENDIILNFGRYGEGGDYLCGYSQKISWDTPEDYFAEGAFLSLEGVTNQEISHLSWNCRNISATFNIQTKYDTYSYKFLNADKSNQYGIGAEDITVTTDRAIPKAIRGDEAYLMINLGENSSADAQAIYTYVWKSKNSPIKAKNYKANVKKKGWYLTGYEFTLAESLYFESRFSDGSLCVDAYRVYDANGDKVGKSTENDIYIYSERFFGAYLPNSFGTGVRSEVKWDSPAAYIAAGGYLEFKNSSNTVLATTGPWGASSTHWYAGTSGFGTEIANPGGDSWPYALEPSTMKTVNALPEGTDGQELKAYIDIISIGKAVYTYTWKDEPTPPSLKKSSITLYLSGSNKNLTYEIELKNATGYTITYKSRNKSVATVSSKGVVTAKKAGKANILITLKKGGKTITKTLKVTVKK